MEISAQNLPETVRYLARVIPQEVLNRIVSPSDLIAPRDLPSLVSIESRSHPFAIAWAALVREADKSASEGTFQLSKQSTFLLHGLTNLNAVQNVPGFRALVNHLVSPAQYFSTLFEADVAAGYVAYDNHVEIIPEEATSRTRSPDIRVGGQYPPVDVECKSLEDLRMREQLLWSHLQLRLTRMLQRYRKPLRIIITAMDYLTGRSSDTIAAAVKTALLNKGAVPTQLVVEGFSLQFFSLGSATDWTPIPLKSEGLTEHSWIEIEISTRTSPASYRMATQIDVKPWRGENHIKRIFRLIDDASSQFAPGHPGIVHIQVPYRDGAQVEEIFDDSFQRIFGYLRTKHPRVNAVVLRGYSIDANALNGDHLLLEASAIVPNPNASVSLPEGFRILGAHDAKLDMVADGAMRIEFETYSAASKQLGRQLFYHCSTNGYYQLRIWQSHRNRLRLDVVNPTRGRTTKAYEADALEEARGHKIALRWKPEPIACALDGQMLTEIGS